MFSSLASLVYKSIAALRLILRAVNMVRGYAQPFKKAVNQSDICPVKNFESKTFTAEFS
jgi:hypothetical protein